MISYFNLTIIIAKITSQQLYFPHVENVEVNINVIIQTHGYHFFQHQLLTLTMYNVTSINSDQSSINSQKS